MRRSDRRRGLQWLLAGAMGLVVGFTSSRALSPTPATAPIPAPSPPPHVEASVRPPSPPAAPIPPRPAPVCADFDAWCATRMALDGCSPLAAPEPIYEPAEVQRWAEELKTSCDAFREEILDIDCAATPCVLLVRAEPEAGGFPPVMEWVESEPFLDELTCGSEGPALHLHGRAHHDVEVDMVVVWPELHLETEPWHRVRLRGAAYEEDELQALLSAQQAAGR